MSILVKGMKAPKSCRECPFLSYAYNVPVCSVTKQISTYPLQETLEQALSKRMNGCPLVEVNPCDTCYIAQNYNLEDDDSPCQNCGEEDD